MKGDTLMKITDKTQRETVPFSFLADGAVFKSEDGSICLKFPMFVYESNEDGLCDGYNAYDLTTDEFTFFSYSERVEKVQAELILNPIIT